MRLGEAKAGFYRKPDGGQAFRYLYRFKGHM